MPIIVSAMLPLRIPRRSNCLIKLLGEKPAELQEREALAALDWAVLIDQVHGRIAIRRFTWGQEPFLAFIAMEIAAGRPVAFTLPQSFDAERLAWRAELDRGAPQ